MTAGKNVSRSDWSERAICTELWAGVNCLVVWRGENGR